MGKMKDKMIDIMNADREAEEAQKYLKLNVKLILDDKEMIKHLEAQRKLIASLFGVPYMFIKYKWLASIYGWFLRMVRFFK